MAVARCLTAERTAGIPLFVPYEPLYHVVLYQPEIPQNTGNVGRTCVAVGAKLWLVQPLGFRLTDSHLRRAGMDYWAQLNWQVVDHWEALTNHLSSQRFWYFSKHARRVYTEVHYDQGDVLVFGSETQGLPATWRQDHPERFLRVPMRREARSLNLASSVAVVVYEAWRQADWFTGPNE